MLKLTYCRKNDKYQTVTVIGSPDGVRDLYWQLTHNYSAQDGTEIGEIKVSNLDGWDITNEVMQYPYIKCTKMCTLEK